MAKSNRDNVEIIVKGNSIKFCGIFFLTLFLLKVGIVETMVMEWSWWWITAPLWGPFAVVAAFFLVAGIIILIGAIIFGAMEKFEQHKRDKK